MENINMTNEEKVMDAVTENIETGVEKSGTGIGKKLLIWGGVALASIAGLALGLIAHNKHEADTELHTPDDDQIIETTDEDIMSVVE